MVISEICCIFIVSKYKEIQTKIAMITEDKITEIYCMADDSCKFFDAQMKKYTIQPQKKHKYHRAFDIVESRGNDYHDSVPWFWLPLPEAFLLAACMQTPEAFVPQVSLL